MEYRNKNIEKSYFVAIVLPSITALNKTTFPDIPQLREKTITGIETFVAADLATDPSGRTVVSTGTGLVVTLVERKTSNEFLRQQPILSLNRSTNNGRLYQFKNRLIDWQRSGVTITNIAGLNPGEVVGFMVYYKD